MLSSGREVKTVPVWELTFAPLLWQFVQKWVGPCLPGGALASGPPCGVSGTLAADPGHPPSLCAPSLAWKLQGTHLQGCTQGCVMRCEAPAARGVASEATSHLPPLFLFDRGVTYMVVTGKGVFISNTEEKLWTAW